MPVTKLFGREPALWLGLVAVLVHFASAFWFHATVDQQAAVNAVAAAVIGVLVAVSVHDGVGAAVTGLVQAAVALAVGLGLHWSADQQALTLALAAAIVAMFTRTQVTAKIAASAQRVPSPIQSP